MKEETHEPNHSNCRNPFRPEGARLEVPAVPTPKVGHRNPNAVRPELPVPTSLLTPHCTHFLLHSSSSYTYSSSPEDRGADGRAYEICIL